MKHILSPSQIETFLSCERKWGWQYIDGIKSESNFFAEWGTVLHKANELWLTEGVVADVPTLRRLTAQVKNINENDYEKIVQIASVGLKHLPVPNHPTIENLMSEGFFELTTERGLHYRGFCDVQHVGPFSIYPRIPVITDFKSTSDFKWAKTVERLQTDTQAMIYAKKAFDSHPWAEVVGLNWIYYLRVLPPRIKLVSLVLSRGHVDVEMQRIDEIAKVIVEKKRTTKRALDLQPNIDTCEAYGGCPHRERCNLSQSERIQAAMRKADLDGRLAALNSQSGPPPAQAPAGVAPPLLPGAAPVGGPPSLPSMAMRGGSPPLPGVVVQSGPPPLPGAPAAPQPLPGANGAAVNPPLVAAPPPLPTAAPAAVPPSAAAPPPVAAVPAAVAAPEPKRGRGRPKRNTNTTAAAAPMTDNGSGRFTLFINCYPIKSEDDVMVFSDLYRAIPNSDLEAALEKLTSSEDLFLFLDTTNPEGARVQWLLESLADVVVRGV